MTRTAKRILIVDDEPSILALMADLLTEQGYIVDQATSGKAALDRIKRNRPDAMLLDMMLPEMTGWAVLEACQASLAHNKIPVAVMSAVVGIPEALALGAQGCIPKPFDLEDVLAVVSDLTQRRRHSRDFSVPPSLAETHLPGPHGAHQTGGRQLTGAAEASEGRTSAFPA